MKVAICDDEKVFLRKIKDLIVNTYPYEDKLFIYEFESGEALLKALENYKYDIIILDIEMNGIDGIKTAKDIRKNDSNVIIAFLTSHQEYAITGYEVNAFRFLLKNSPKTYYIKEFKSIYSEYHSRHISFEIKADNILHNIPIKEIIYFEVYKRLILMHTVKNTYEYYGKLSEIEADERLIGFVKPYKSYYINMAYIEKIGPKSIKLKTISDDIPLSRNNIKTVTDKYVKFIAEGF